MLRLAWLIPFLPLAGFLVTGLGYRRLSVKVSGWIASLAVLGSFLLSAIAFGTIIYGAPPTTFKLFDWLSTGTITFPAVLLVDRLSVFMLLIITGVGFLIHVYSIGYMHGDEGYNRFFSFMNLFVFFMTLLVMGGSYLIMFIGWEGVGLCSYLLIGFWYRNQEYNNAAKKAFIMNRMGDLGFILGMFLMYTVFGSLSFSSVFDSASALGKGTPAITAIALLLFAGATGKSAQIPLLTWLPDAMAGPTPVSALIHAATMVTAGVYMIARSNVIYLLSPVAMTIVAVTGTATAFFAATVALFQNDIKKILAYSTISQLGLMFLGLGAGAFSGAMFHLMTHAFFKALLFLAAGSIIHSLGGEQDIRKMGNLRHKLPFTAVVFLIAVLAISGIPPFSGFFSKDELLMSSFNHSPMLWLAGVLVSVLTAFYMFRLFWITFTGSFRGTELAFSGIHESTGIMSVPMAILAFLSLTGGLFGLPEPFGKNFIDSYFAPVFGKSASLLNETARTGSGNGVLLMAVTLIVIIISVISAWYLFVRKGHVPVPDDKVSGRMIKAGRGKFYLDELYRSVITQPLMRLSSFLHDMIDIKIIDRFVEWIGKVILVAGDRIRLLQTGNVGFYLFAMLICILAVIFINVFLKR